MIRTAECITPNHPDKICDRISDRILDACLEQDPNTRAAIETMGGHGIITVTGELSTDAFVDIPEIVKAVYGKDIGVQTNIVMQSPEIAQGVDTGGAGDQGIMIGYACTENEEMVPQEYYLARKLCESIFINHPYDGKTQVTILDDNSLNVVASFQNTSSEDLVYHIEDFFAETDYTINSLHCNPAGEWNLGGFDADTGLTGRKLAVDNYGPRIPLGGGAFSGKDSSKVDRSAAYMARRIATDYIEKYNAEEVYVTLAYAIGHDKPLQATALVDGKEVNIDDYNLTPKGIVEFLGLKQPIFYETSKWGHMGKNFSWN
tara:strand:+ start:602 stop:1552 length:951 start_codon:yes stop_codon:yes gene_type:complete